jgi:ribosomal protein L10
LPHDQHPRQEENQLKREEKVSRVGKLNETFTRAKFVVVTDYRGLKVTELESAVN